MPILLIEAPVGAQVEAKQKLMRQVSDAIEEAYQFHDVRVWLREYPLENVAQDGRVGSEPVRPVCFLEAPELSSLEARRTMAAKIQAAVAEAYAGLANTDETLVMMNHYPLEMAGFAGRLQSDDPDIVAAVKHLNG
jgi:phenylpyruvate tautomerase PptA (4-oxalocrotonate tautomerase family)